MSSINPHFDDAVLDRLKKTLNLKTDSQLADYLNVQPTVIANWRSRGRINATRVISKCESLDVHWILFGTPGGKQREKESRPYEHSDEIVERSGARNIAVSDDFEQLEDEKRKVELENMQLRSKLEVLENLIVRLKKDSGNEKDST